MKSQAIPLFFLPLLQVSPYRCCPREASALLCSRKEDERASHAGCERAQWAGEEGVSMAKTCLCPSGGEPVSGADCLRAPNQETLVNINCEILTPATASLEVINVLFVVV